MEERRSGAAAGGHHGQAVPAGPPVEPLAGVFVRLVNRPLPLSIQRLPLRSAQCLAGPVGEYVLLTRADQVIIMAVMGYHFNCVSRFIIK